jgi:hypothetical protein
MGLSAMALVLFPVPYSNHAVVAIVGISIKPDNGFKRLGDKEQPFVVNQGLLS